VIEDGAIVGMGSIVLNRARVGGRTMLAAGSVVTEDGEIPPEVLAAGAPAEAKKDLDGSSSKWVEDAAREYQALRLRYMGGAQSAVTGSPGDESAQSAE
jgi:carbonic anhydrase/acetyltransferase-like protein (isoleucine patch superfamily)